MPQHQLRRMYLSDIPMNRMLTHHFLTSYWLFFTFTPGLCYFLGDSKAVLGGCVDRWTLQDGVVLPLLNQMTTCVHVRVVTPGDWIAFQYISDDSPKPELGLEGDKDAIYGWLLGVRHRFPLSLTPTYWHQLCLRRDVIHNSFSLEIDGEIVAERTVFAKGIHPTGSLRLGCMPTDRPRGVLIAQVELYLFRMWEDMEKHISCEDGSVIGWDSAQWGVTSSRARQIDSSLACAYTCNVGPVSPAMPGSLSLSPGYASPIPARPTTTPILTTNTLFNQSQLTDSLAAYSSQAAITSITPLPSLYRKSTTGLIPNLNPKMTTGFSPKLNPNMTRGLGPNPYMRSLNPNINPIPITYFSPNHNPNTTIGLNAKRNSNTITYAGLSLNLSPKTDIIPNHNPNPVTGLSSNLNPYITTGLSPNIPNVTMGLSRNFNFSTSTKTKPDESAASVPKWMKEELKEEKKQRISEKQKEVWKNASGEDLEVEEEDQDMEKMKDLDTMLNQTQQATQLNSSLVDDMMRHIEHLLPVSSISQPLAQKALTVISNLIDKPKPAIPGAANRLIQMVDGLGLKLVVKNNSEILSSSCLVVAVKIVNGTSFQGAFFSVANPDNLQVSVHSRFQKDVVVRLGSVTLPPSLTDGLTPEQQQLASRVQFTFYRNTSFFQDPGLVARELISPVLGSSVANLSISNLTDNLQFTLRNIRPIPVHYVKSCVFWDFHYNGGVGGWNSAGCFAVNSSEDETTCSCSHLTSFAVLLDLSREGVRDMQNGVILTLITYIGCGISAIFLFITLLTYVSFQTLRCDIPSKILVQLCLSLLLLNLVFLLDGWLALFPIPGLCISTAFFLHYFLLTSFTWSGLEALHMYLSIVRVFNSYLSRYMLKLSLMGWGAPLLVVMVVISVDKNNYGLVSYGRYLDGSSDDFCWLRSDVAFYVGVVAYFCLVFFLNLLVFLVVLLQVGRIKKHSPHNLPPRGRLADLRSATGLSILLGLTWGFALFAWGPLNMTFMYLFSIFNSLQGFLVFVFHCAVKESVRRHWRSYLCCGRLHMVEVSDWCHMPTQNPGTLPVTRATISDRGSSFSSGQSNGSGSIFGDSVISEGFNGDVVLNKVYNH